MSDKHTDKNTVHEAQLPLEPIAVVGMSCRFPGIAENISGFWGVLSTGKHVIADIPVERFDIDKYLKSNKDSNELGKTYVAKGAFLNNVAGFDAPLFDISPREATAMDPQQRILLECSWEALEDAGIAPNSLSESKTSVFAGVNEVEYKDLLQGSSDHNAHEVYIPTGTFLSAIAGRISYTFGFEGPSMVVDTHYSASLSALHLACQNLRSGESEMSLVAGSHLILTPEGYIIFSRLNALAADGISKTFDESSDGFGRGEGCGVLILKRLSDALQSGDRIHAVIRGSAMNQDGRSISMTAPNVEAQENVIRNALKSAHVKPADVGYIEAHGTGTPLGDPIEIQALAEVFKNDRKNKTPLYIGSVKTNIGHLEGASGMAGVIKVILGLKNKKIPKHLHLKELNHKINLKQIPAIIPDKLTSWRKINGARIAGVSSFGLAGTNVHAILEEAPNVLPVANNEVERSAHVLCLSAKTQKSLDALVDKYLTNLKDSEVSLADLCYSENTGRAHLACRLSVVSSSIKQLIMQLNAWKSGNASIGIVYGEEQEIKDGNKDICFLFTGQGSQYIDMARELYDTQPSFKVTLDICARILEKHLDKKLLSVLWGKDKKLVNDTKYTQPALFALEYSLSRLLQKWGVEPQALIGHSVGEYVAACIAGVFSLDDGLYIISKRATLMSALPKIGKMVALATTEEHVRESITDLESEVSIAAINGPESIVISGNVDVVDKLSIQYADAGCKTKDLNTSHAFHSHLLDPMLKDFEKVLSKIKFRHPEIPIVSNLTGKFILDEEISSSAYWISHTRHTVQFKSGMQTLFDSGCSNFIEIGPNPVLLSMAHDCATDKVIDNSGWCPTLKEDQDIWSVILESLGTLYTRGVNINWQEFDSDYLRSKVDVPTYQFEHNDYWVSDVKLKEKYTTGELIADLELSTEKDTPQKKNKFIKTIHESPESERKALVENYLQVHIRIILRMSDDVQFNILEGFTDIGITSLLSEELRDRLNKSLGVTLSRTIIFDYPNINSLANYLLSDILHLEDKKERRYKYDRRSRPDVAIIGMSCRFPGGANSLNKYWNVLNEGRSAISEVPEDRWSLDTYYDPDPLTAGKMYSKWGGFLNTPVADFDAKFFGISGEEAKMMDPQQRLALEVTWEAIENAGIAPESLFETQTGVFFGVSSSDYADIVQQNNKVNVYTNSGTNHSVLVGRISYILGLQGPSIAMDTACSSSLVAIHEACKSLRSNETHLAIAGGVNLMLSPRATIGYCKGGFLSWEGKCRTFDARADGYVRAEGSGVLILKRLSDALKDNDNILGVIRGSAVNQDGASGGLTVPNGPAQGAVITQALKDANVEASEVDYVEAHGTGTPLGDPIEMNTLSDIFTNERDKNHKVAIGSVKTNVGHLEAAAGIAGVIKIILSMQNQVIPRHLHLKNINPDIKFNRDLVYIPTENLAWLRGGRKRIAGISGFAFQGTNSHLIIEEPPLQLTSQSNDYVRPFEILTFSAKTVPALADMCMEHAEFLKENPDILMKDLAYSLNICRNHFPYRVAIIVPTKNSNENFIIDLRKKIEKVAARLNSTKFEFGDIGNTFSNIVKIKNKATVFINNELNSDKLVEYIEIGSNPDLAKNFHDWDELMIYVAQLYVNGTDIDWDKFDASYMCSKVALPTYPFQRKRYWVGQNKKAGPTFEK